MNTRHSSGWLWPALAVVCLTVLFFANKAATQSQGGTATANVKTAGGLTVVTFVVNPGTIKVNLPDDMRAGDTISGTVITEPKGNTKEERGANQSELNKLGIRIKFSELPEEKPKEVSCGDVAVPFTGVYLNDKKVNGLVMELFEKLGKALAQMKIAVPTHPSGAVITPDPKMTPTFTIPPLGQTGRPFVITGPFDGDSSNTILDFDPGLKPESVSEFAAGLEYELRAESPRKAVFEAPPNVTGPIGVKLKEGNVETKGTYRNVGVNLSAPKTNLLKGEKTTLTVQVSGLEGIKEPVPLTLECKGVITMEGGIYQPLIIQPSQVGADGRYTTTRGITGVQTGGWEATATVVTGRFNVWLQDDSDPNRIFHFNSFTGDYIFACGGGSCRPSGSTGGTQTGGTTGKPGGTTQPGGTDQPGGTLPGGTGPPPIVPPPPVTLTGTGKPAMKGCIITLSHNAPDRRVFARLDACTKSGDASVQTNSPKTDIKITDKNTADSTAPSPPPK